MISEWPTPTSWEEVRAFCYLTPFLRRFIPGRAELVRIMKTGMEVEIEEEKKGIGNQLRRDQENLGATPGRKEPEGKEMGSGKKGGRIKGVAKKLRKEEGPFQWTDEQDCAFRAMKLAIVTNAMALPDPERQYHLAVDASKRGIGGVLFQLDGIAEHVEANNSTEHQERERMLMFLSFKLEDAETRYSNLEREALAVVRCLAEVKWMVIASPYSILVYNDHEALKVLLTVIDNDAHGHIAKWQERLGEYNFRLIHRTASTHFMGIADGLSRLPSALMQRAFIEDSDGPRPQWAAVIASGQHGINVRVPTTAVFATKARLGIGLLKGKRGTWQNGKYHGGDVGEDAMDGGGDRVGVVEVVLGEQDEGGRLEMAAKALKRRKWQRWLDSGYYGQVVRLKMEGMRAVEEFKLALGKGELRALENKAKRYRMSEGQEARLYWQESDGQLAACVLEDEVERVLMNLHDGHGHLAAGITGGRAHGRFFWPTRQKDIGQWVSSCEPCQRMTKMQKSGQSRPILQFGPMDVVGMNFIGPINPPCEATGAVYILLVVDYFSRFTFGAALQKADQQATMQFIVDKIVPIVWWPKSVYSDNGSHFTGNAIRQMWKDHRVLQFTAAISHPQSVGLSERYVQMTMGRIWLR